MPFIAGARPMPRLAIDQSGVQNRAMRIPSLPRGRLQPKQGNGRDADKVALDLH